MLGKGLGEDKEEEDGCFTLLDIFEAYNTRSPGRADPQVKFSASSKNHISYSRCYIMNTNGQNVQNCLRNPQT